MDKVVKYLREGEEVKKTLTLYHGVKDPKNVAKILKTGFKLIYIRPRWTNDYAISAVKTRKQVENFFGRRDITVLKFKFTGNVYVLTDRFDTVPDYIVGNCIASQTDPFNLIMMNHVGINYIVISASKTYPHILVCSPDIIIKNIITLS